MYAKRVFFSGRRICSAAEARGGPTQLANGTSTLVQECASSPRAKLPKNTCNIELRTLRSTKSGMRSLQDVSLSRHRLLRWDAPRFHLNLGSEAETDACSSSTSRPILGRRSSKS